MVVKKEVKNQIKPCFVDSESFIGSIRDLLEDVISHNSCVHRSDCAHGILSRSFRRGDESDGILKYPVDLLFHSEGIRTVYLPW